MHPHAQTILQLQRQLAAAGHTPQVRRYFSDVHALAAALFSGQFRGSGKPFDAHLVGTASILLRHGAAPAVAAAGLLHAAYEQGDFGHGGGAVRAADRAEVARVAGEEAERWVLAYTHYRWSDDSILGAAQGAAAADALTRTLLLMRLANELEDHLDRGILYCANFEERLRRLERVGTPLVDLTRALGHAELAQELQNCIAETLLAAREPLHEGARSHSYLRVPRSCGRRLLPRIARRAARLAR